eukprot:m.553590 g.553590  ORF g.553590 m.553590 type:complete len:75 (-) comp22171_c0_seq4:2838-3062(-)
MNAVCCACVREFLWDVCVLACVSEHDDAISSFWITDIGGLFYKYQDQKSRQQHVLRICSNAGKNIRATKRSVEE